MLFVALLFTIASQAQAVNPFVTDGCTGYFDGTHKHPKLWYDCCVEHDFRFWVGGTKLQKHAADSRLKECVKEKGAPLNAEVMYLGVKLGHLSPFKLKDKQWGNGLGQPQMNRPLTEAERGLFVEEIQKADLNPELRTTFLDYLSKIY